MIQKVKDQNQFLLVTVETTKPYQVLYLVIPSINQIQRIAHKFDETWRALETGYRTIRETLPKRWCVSIVIEEISLDKVRDICPAALDIEFSIKMLEDKRLRRLRVI